MKPSNQKTLFKSAIGQCKTGFAAVLLFSLCVNLLALVTPIYMMQLFDRVLTSQNTDTMMALFALALGGLFAMSLLDGFRNMLLSCTGSWIDRILGAPILTKTISIACGKQINGAQPLRDLSSIRGFLFGPSILPFMDAPWVPFFLAFLFLLHPQIGVLASVGGVLLFIIGLVNEKLTRKNLAEASGASLQAQDWADAAVRNADVVQAMGMGNDVVRHWNQHYEQALMLQNTVGSRSTVLTSLSKFLRLVLQIGVLTLGAYLAIQGEMTGGAMIAASMIMGKALSPVEQSITAWKGLIGARNAYGRLKLLLEDMAHTEPSTPLPKPLGKLDVETLTYASKLGDDPIIKMISFQLKPGESLGLIGPTAAGKSTLARLLVGSLAPTDGHVRLDGMDMSAWEAQDRGQHIGYLPQDVELFEGSIAQNIMRLREGDTEMMYEVAKMAGVHEMIMRFPQGYDTLIGERGLGLSGGQRQRIGLARALYGNPALVVLDEPNANLDGDGEDALEHALKALKEKGIGAVVIAHRPSVVRCVDKILLLKDGKCQLFGPRDEVIAQMKTPMESLSELPKKKTRKTLRINNAAAE